MTIRAVGPAIVYFLIVTVAALGGAAKRSQYPSPNHKSTYLCKAAKMSEAGLHQADSSNSIPDLLPDYGISVVSRDLRNPLNRVSRFLTASDRILRIELQSPPLLV